MTTDNEPVKIRLPRRQRILCATAFCTNKVLAEPEGQMTEPAFCPTCQWLHEMTQPEAQE